MRGRPDEDLIDIPDFPDTHSDWYYRQHARFHRMMNPDFGGHYDITSGVQFRFRDHFDHRLMMLARIAIPFAPAVVASAKASDIILDAYQAVVIDSLPEQREHEERSWWQFWSAGLTGFPMGGNIQF